jgi:putative transposase
MREIWFTKKDIRSRLGEVKRIFWGEVGCRVREAVKVMLEEGLKGEMVEQLEVGHYERSAYRRDYRNGYILRCLRSSWGELLGVRVPRSRRGVYKSRVLDRYARYAGDFDRRVQESVILGLSTRKAQEFFRAFLGEEILSASGVSLVLKRLDEEVRSFHQRPLKDEYIYLFVDGFPVRISQAYKRPYMALVALGIKPDGSQEIIDFTLVSSEKTILCQSFLENLYRRGLEGKKLKLMVHDGAPALFEASQWIYPKVPQQGCWIHKLRNIAKSIRKRAHRKALLNEVKRVFQAPNLSSAVQQAKRLVEKLKTAEPQAINKFCFNLDWYLNFYHQPKNLWTLLSSTNHLERKLKELRRRVKLIDSFKNQQSADRWLFALINRLNQREITPLNKFTQKS